MNKILKQIESRSDQLSQNPFCQWILSEGTQRMPPEDILSFAPSMLYFILGFRDILQQLEYTNPQSEIEKIVNQHCKEDKDHWRWYLEDLKTLGFNDQSWGPDFASRIETLWHDDNKPTRDLVYLCIYLIRRNRTPQSSLVIIECLEATFGVFMTTLQKRFGHSSVYKKLHFFGHTHHHQEASHSIGHWIEDEADSSDLHAESHWDLVHFTPEEEADMSKVVQVIFEQFEVVFKSWLESRLLYSQKQADGPRQLELN